MEPSTEEELDVGDHPLLAQLKALKSAFDRAQDELHRNSLKLQSHYLDASNEHDLLHALRQENELLKAEVTSLRATPHPSSLPSSHPAISQSAELTLSLRKLNDKLTLTEESLLRATQDADKWKSEAQSAKKQEEKAYELAARIRGREEAGRERERVLERAIKEGEERERMGDVVVREYANLVRDLEGRMGVRRSSSSSTASGKGGAGRLDAVLAEGRSGLKKLMQDHDAEVSELQKRVSVLEGENEELTARLEAAQKAGEADVQARAQAEYELETLKVDDGTAAKMVSRYMKFSQTQTDTLQTTITALSSRHEATVSSLTSQVYNLTQTNASLSAQLTRFQNALNELGGEMVKESVGRRMEVGLRVAMVAREEATWARLERWVERASKSSESGAGLVEEAKAILASLDVPGVHIGDAQDEVSVSGSLGRLLTAQYLVDQMRMELDRANLHREGEELERKQEERPDASPPSPPVEAESYVDQSDGTEVDDPPIVPTKEDQEVVEGAPGTPLARSIASIEGPTIQDMSSTNQDTTASLSPRAQETNTILLELEALELEAHALDEHVGSTVVDVDVSLPPEPMQPIGVPEPTVLDTNPNVEKAEGAPTPTLSMPTVSLSPHLDVAKEPTPEAPVETLPPSRVTSIPPPLLLEPEPLPDVPEVKPSTEVEADVYTAAVEPEPVHPLIPRLHETSRRYDAIQAGFKDCHTTLAALKASLPPAPSSTASLTLVPQDTAPEPTLPREVIDAVLERLTDFIEDAQVELEIQKSDEALLVKGYETILTLGASGAAPLSALMSPGLALSPPSTAGATPSPYSGRSFTSSLASLLSPNTPTMGTRALPRLSESESVEEAERRIEAFVEGTEVGVVRAVQVFRKKLEDVRHDVARISEVVHGKPDSGSLLSPPPSAPLGSSVGDTEGNVAEDQEGENSDALLCPKPRRPSSSSSSSWSSWLRPPPQTRTSPRPSSPGPSTFGDIMTSPRLRHSPSLTGSLRRPSSAASNGSGASSRERVNSGTNGGGDVLAGLGLRIAMPKFAPPAPTPVPAGTPRTPSSGSATGISTSESGDGTQDSSRSYPVEATVRASTSTPPAGHMGMNGFTPRARTISSMGMGMVGLRRPGTMQMNMPSRASSLALSASTSSSSSSSSSGSSLARQATGHSRNNSASGARNGRGVERDIDGDTDLESEAETETDLETETEGGGSDSDF
ncbi:hypothetical protein DFP72DRAFT_510549 [Ephemerocybe angulata]|uniref:Uncharacterized protein n=1 Tax=Ephemerocybe angulata TaxID=980116 RepID=A0A8H6M052_9AGAR|nr:hypothetical protein DFP72DRAFT_510549 [Tulosesus angulatus]